MVLQAPALVPESDAEKVAFTMWQRDPQAQRLGMVVVAAALGTATVEMPLDERHLGDHQLAHGGTLFVMADVAMSYACNTYDIHALATGATISFVDSAYPGERLIAHAVEHSLRGKAGIYDVTVRSLEGTDPGRLIATFRGTTLRVGGSVINLEPRKP